MKHSFLACIALVLTVQQQQCDLGNIVAGKTVRGVQEYFPAAEVKSTSNCVLIIATGVSNVSEKLLFEIAKGLYESPKMGELKTGMTLAGYNYVVLTFQDKAVIFGLYAQGFWVLGEEEAVSFAQNAFNPCVSR